MKYINELLKKSRPKTFMDYAPGEIPKKLTKAQEPLTLGEVAPKATERVAPRVTAKEESTYTTSDKDLQNIHKNRTYNSYRKSAQTNVGAGVLDRPHSRTTLQKAPTQKPQPIKLPYRPSVQGPPRMTQYGKQTAPAYDSPVKIVGNNVTEKDYEDFWEAFRKESTADKLNWAANIAKPHNTAKRQYVTGENGRKLNPELNADKRKQKDCRRYKCSA